MSADECIEKLSVDHSRQDLAEGYVALINRCMSKYLSEDIGFIKLIYGICHVKIHEIANASELNVEFERGKLQELAVLLKNKQDRVARSAGDSTTCQISVVTNFPKEAAVPTI
jgi:hypothetical protein